MNFKRFAIAGVVAGLAVGIVTANTGSPDRTSPEDIATDYGLRPVSEVVDIFDSRISNGDGDYINRTELGIATAGLASEEASLELYAESLDVFSEALQNNPNYRPARLGMASSLASLHRFDEALVIAEEILATTPDSIGAQVVAADALHALGRYDESDDRYLVLAEESRSAPIVARLAQSAWDRGQHDEALKLAEEALQLSAEQPLRPHSRAFYWFQLGHFQFETGDIDSSLKTLNKAIEIAPAHPGANEKLASVYLASGDAERAEELLTGLIDAGPAADLLSFHADLLELRGDTEAAAVRRDEAAALAELTRDDYPAERRHLVGYYLTQDPAVALELAEQDLTERLDWGAWYTHADALFANGRTDEAVISLERALDTGASTAPLHFLAGQIYASAGNQAQARSHFETALQINPYFDLDDAAEARQILETQS